MKAVKTKEGDCNVKRVFAILLVLCTVFGSALTTPAMAEEELIYSVILPSYEANSGPAYETPAEISAYERFGADAVGMSTAVEAMAARHMGKRVCGISCITNMAAGRNDAPLTHEEVKETADRVAGQFKQLVTESITAIHKHINA